MSVASKLLAGVRTALKWFFQPADTILKEEYNYDFENKPVIPIFAGEDYLVIIVVLILLIGAAMRQFDVLFFLASWLFYSTLAFELTLIVISARGRFRKMRIRTVLVLFMGYFFLILKEILTPIFYILFRLFP